MTLSKLSQTSPPVSNGMNHESIIIFTDGSSRGNPGPGGFGAILVGKFNVGKLESSDKTVIELGGREGRTTNNRMELTAAIKALQKIQDSGFPRPTASAGLGKIQVFTDSSYLVKGITAWVYGWQKNGWKTRENKEVENRDLWEKLIAFASGKEIEWTLVSGHVGVPGNARCDEIATSFADGKKPDLYSGPLAEYPIRNILDIKKDEVLEKEKQEKRQHQKAKAFSYVSKVVGVVKTHGTWADCEARVRGKKARYKKVLSRDEEIELVKEWSKRD